MHIRALKYTRLSISKSFPSSVRSTDISRKRLISLKATMSSNVDEASYYVPVKGRSLDLLIASTENPIPVMLTTKERLDLLIAR